MKKLETVLIRFALKTVFALFSLKRIDGKLVVFADERQDKMPQSMSLVYSELQAAAKYRMVVILPKSKNRSVFSRFFDMVKFTRYYACAKYIVLEDYYYPLYVNRRREGTRVIQLWHSCGPFKKFGYQCIDNEFGMDRSLLKKYPIHTNYTHIPVCSEDTIPCLADGFNLGEDERGKVFLPVGLPRTDIFFDADFRARAAKKLRGLFPGINGRKVLLYAPTFRGKIGDAQFEGKLDMHKMKEALGDRYVLVTKLHPFIKNPAHEDAATADFYRDATGRLTIEEALCVADICISDYSSLIFEYSLFLRPMIFYTYDFEYYMRHRGTYYDYESFVPGRIVRTCDELIEAVRTVDGWFKKEQLAAFKDKYMRYCSGQSTKDLVARGKIQPGQSAGLKQRSPEGPGLERKSRH